MKLSKLNSLFLILFSASIVTSCSNEPVDPALASQIAANNATTSSGGSTGSGGGSSSGDYFPTALNNQWTYTQNGAALSPTQIISIDNINGFTYYTFSPTSGGSSSGLSANATQRVRKSSGDYFLKTDDNTFSSGGISGNQTGFELLILKDYLPVGGTWTGSYTQTTTYNNSSIPAITATTNYTGTILEVGSSVTVGTSAFSDVIKMRLHESVDYSGAISAVDTDYWFAKNVGIIKSITYQSGSTTTPQYTTLLTSYTLH